jgi:lambda repressor-like predicted transcriptional regulator
MMVEKHEIIKGMLQLKGTSISEVARELGVAPTTVTVVSKGMRRSKRIETALAAAIGSTPEVVWPERYTLSDVSPGKRSNHAVRHMFGAPARGRNAQ